MIKEYHAKIKILDEKGFDQSTITIPLYKNESLQEKMQGLRAVNHIGNIQYNVLPSEVFTKDVSEYKMEKSFTFPKLQKGCILEYSYTIISPFVYKFTGWDFQSDIPKIKSEFHAKIPGNYVYNRALVGPLELNTNDAQIQKNCFYIDGYQKGADCEVLHYAMNDIPAFKAEKEFMLSEKNYISRLDFELSEYHGLDGTKDNYTKNWNDVDQDFRSDKDVGRQLTKKGFFEKNVPDNLLTEGDPLTRAMNIYEFVKNHFSWTGAYGIYGKARIKEAFEKRKGSVGEINMSLINLLNVAGIKTNLMLLSTRSEGLPKKSHPVMSDFNYSIAKTEVDGKEYLLDATDKHMPFGMLPFRALNHYGRVMDFNNESYWHQIKPQKNNRYQVRANIRFNIDTGKAEGVLDIISMGYTALSAQKDFEQFSPQDYRDRMENKIGGEYQIVGHELLKESGDDKKVSERYSFEIENAVHGDMLYYNPFILRFFDKNPFELENRTYPIDFGYQRQFKYQLTLEIPQGYAVHEIPKNQAVQLGNQLVELKFKILKGNGQIGILFDLNLNKSFFEANAYEDLRNVFKHVTDIQKNTLVVLKKENGRSK